MWEEVQDINRVNDPVVVEVPAETAQQCFYMNLIQQLFAELDMDKYVVNTRQG